MFLRCVLTTTKANPYCLRKIGTKAPKNISYVFSPSHKKIMACTEQVRFTNLLLFLFVVIPCRLPFSRASIKIMILFVGQLQTCDTLLSSMRK